MFGIIAGTGIYSIARKIETKHIITPYGVAIVDKIKFPSNTEAWFISRHGKGHIRPPHKVNYKANTYALKKLGVNGVFAVYSVGIISKYKVGDLILLDDFIALGIRTTFFDSFARGIRHKDMHEPYNRELIGTVKSVAKSKGIKVKDGGIVYTTYGPRFETRAEIKAIKSMGANLVSMTAGYEAILLNELEIPLVAVAIGTNYACGIRRAVPNAEEVIENVSKARAKIDSILNAFLAYI